MTDRLDPDALYHLVTPIEWDGYQGQGTIVPSSLATEGFAHCSWGRQVPGTVAKHFAGVAEVLALRLDRAAVADHLVEEDSYGSGQAFPHVYAEIPVGAVVEVSSVVATT